jgi:CheY-like chemotaxis protein
VILKVVKSTLEREGHLVDVAMNGKEALNKMNAADFAYDVILTDIQMPVMDGVEFIQRLRENEVLEGLYSGRDRHQLVIAMSANPSVTNGQEYLTAGMDGFLAKPFKIEQFNNIFQAKMESNESSEALLEASSSCKANFRRSSM